MYYQVDNVGYSISEGFNDLWDEITEGLTNLWDSFFSNNPAPGPGGNTASQQAYDETYLWVRLGEYLPVGRTVQKGSSGTLVKNVQIALCLLNYYPCGSDIDGIFGSKTEKAVKDFQQYSGLSEDGVVSTNTSYALLDYLESRDKDDDFIDMVKGTVGDGILPDDFINTIKPFMLPVAIGGLAILLLSVKWDGKDIKKKRKK